MQNSWFLPARARWRPSPRKTASSRYRRHGLPRLNRSTSSSSWRSRMRRTSSQGASRRRASQARREALAPTSAAQQQILYVGIGALMTGALVTLLISGSLAPRRHLARVGELPQDRDSEEARKEPLSKVKRLQRASLVVLATLLATLAWVPVPGKAEENANLPSLPPTMATDMPQRMADGSLFVPKATQHLLSIRTVLTAESRAPRTVQLAGTVIGDPNSFGRVQAARAGTRRGAGRRIGVRRQAGQERRSSGLSAALYRGADKANIESQIAEAEARIVKLRTTCPATTSGRARFRKSGWTRSRGSSTRS